MKFIIKVITEVDDGCFLVEYYKGMAENGDVVLTEDLGESAVFEDEEKCDSIIEHLCVLLDYIPKTIEKKKLFQVNPKL